MSQNVEAVKEERQKERDFEEELQLLKGAQHQDNDPRQIRKDLVEDIKDSPLAEPSGEILKNLLSSDFIFANYSREEVTELKHMLRLKKRQFYEQHPAPECLIIGSDRAYVNDDPQDKLRPLSGEQELAVDQLFWGVYARITRSKEMRGLELLFSSISENRVKRESRENGGGGSGGLLGRWRS